MPERRAPHQALVDPKRIKWVDVPRFRPKNWKIEWEVCIYTSIAENIDNIEEKYFPHSTLIKYYKESDLYINLARIESFGISFIESLASGVPVITFNKKGANEIIINNFNGFKINSNKIKDFIKKIKFIYKNKIILRKMRNNSKNSAKQYDLTLVTKKLFKVYKIKRNKINE